MPTEVTLPFGLHINADWLLNISRSGLREIEDNPWQRDIADRIADVLASFLGWIARTFSEPASAQAAFVALAPPSPGAGGLEALLAKDRWLSRLRTQLEDAAVLPVWAEETDALAFAKPSDAIHPPPPLAEAFKEQPALRPAVLLKGPVVMDGVLGSEACSLLDQAGLLAEMSPQDLDRAWPDGLARWWKTLADDQEGRRALLFRIWAAVAELTSENSWQDVALPCIRTATGRWLPVNDVVFFDEPFPSEREPGGVRARRFVRPFIPDKNRLPDGWIGALRREAESEGWKGKPLSQALEWVKEHARHISLREVAEEAMSALASSPTPDWSVLVPFGHWAKHRNRPDLLTRVLVESNAGSMGVPAEEALLADPYVEDRQGRRLLFPTKSAISAAYLEQDPKKAGAYEWRVFFEKSHVKGKLEVRLIKNNASQWERGRVAEFLGLDVGDSNRSGYELLDFDIEPDLPGPDAPQELRTALSAWVVDGCKALEDKGRRKARYFYYSPYNRKGNTPSAWVVKLTDLAWIPCEDGALRRPEDVLPRSDPGREDAPVAKLPSELLRVLELEGVKFGAAIPEATALRKLSAAGSGLDAEALAQLLRECREEITTDEDRRHLEKILETLTVPIGDNQRVPLNRIVLRAGGRGRRGALGSWIVPLDRIDEALRVELKHLDFPYEFPDTTTGEQALAYIRNVWRDARSAPEGLASKVRDVLPAAYAYCLEDRAEDDSLSEQWRATVPEAMIFAEREWVTLAESDDIYFGDIHDRRFFPENMQLRIVTGGHLGNSPDAQFLTAKALDLPLLSSSIEMEWYGEDETLPVADNWVFGFNLICQLLRGVRGSERAESDEAEVDTGTGLRLAQVRALVLEVMIKGTSPERVPVNARLHQDVLIVSGRPVQFGSDAAKELLRHFSFGQRGDLAADLTGMLSAIDNPADFGLAADKFRRSFAPDFELPEILRCESDPGQAAGSGDEPDRTADTKPHHEKMAARGRPGTSTPLPRDSEQGKSDSSGDASGVGVRDGGPDISGRDEPASTSGSYPKDRALAQQDVLAEKLRKSLKGELVPENDDDGPSESARTNGSSGSGLGDEEYRKAVMQYEKKAGREPELGDPHQPGWDIRSVDPKTGEIVRLIEVKGKGCPWVDDEVVELSRAQVRKAFEASDGRTEGGWYLYVVEKTDDGDYRVLPVANPTHAAKWILCGRSWRAMAEAEIRRDASRSDRNR